MLRVAEPVSRVRAAASNRPDLPGAANSERRQAGIANLEVRFQATNSADRPSGRDPEPTFDSLELPPQS